MFRISRSFSRLNGGPRRPALSIGTRPQPALFRQPQLALLAPSIAQRASFASKTDDRADPPPPKQPIDYEAERKIGERKLEARPSEVSLKSSTTNELKTPIENKADSPILGNELRHDMGIIKETFSLDNVPRESKILGLAGTLPYFATSLSTIYLGWDLKQTVPTGNAFYDFISIDHGTAQYLLSVIEPVQLGYGAVIISFLGAIHWGLEYAEKTPHPERTRFRYGMGLLASVVAWPTLIMPVPYALTTQFMAFVGLYFADARATTRGWAPTWYGSYRFMLTAMVGLALFVSLVGRQKMSQGNTLTEKGLEARLQQTGRADHETDWAKLEAEEKERLRKEKAEAEKKAKKEAGKKEKKGKEAKKAGKAAEEAKESKSDDKKDGKGEQEDDQKSKKKDDGDDDEKDKEDSKKEDDKQESKDDNKDEKEKDKNEDNKGKNDDDNSEETNDDEKENGEDKKDSKDEKANGKDDKDEGSKKSDEASDNKEEKGDKKKSSKAKK